MTGPRSFAPIFATLTAVGLCLSAASAHAGGYHPGYQPGYFGGYHGNYSGFHAGYSGGYHAGYYPGYFSYYNSYSPSVYYAPSVYSTPGYAYPSPPLNLYSGTGRRDLGPEEQPPGPPPPDGAAAIGVRVPPDAEVWFNGDATKQKGEEREFVTPTLPVGRNYEYDVRARWMDNGKEVDQTRTITVRANERTEVDFTQPPQEKVGPPK